MSDVTACENCQKPITGPVRWTADDVPLCDRCFDAIWPKRTTKGKRR